MSWMDPSAVQSGLPPNVAGCTGVLGGLLQEYGTGAAGAACTLGLLITIALCALFNLLIGGAPQAT
ncbi:hypothetical protein NKH73_15215 [Mesorhizobium sp. M0938]|uniref:hypothetical protein n=1 Tax=unclassified Mesorhizobium TaxID=325217 RepID=UPI00333B2BBA